MKNMRKIFSILLVMMLIVSFSLTAFAAQVDGETYTITIENAVDGHTYEAYQILAGKSHTFEDETKVLTEITWGANATKTGDVSEADMAEIAAGKGSDFVDFSTEPVGSSSTKTADDRYVIQGLASGYYLVKDKDDSLTGNDAYTAFILEVVENAVVEPKSIKPTVFKQVQDEVADAEAGSVDGWGNTADHAINESFQFKLTATLPADNNYAFYDTYKVVFTDTMSAGITFESIESVKVGNTTLATTQYTCTATEGQAGGSWTLTIADLTEIDGVTLTNGTTVEVVYKAHLNENALANTPADNGVYLEYSNNPNVGGEGDMGKTPEDHVFVYTYQVDNIKKAESETGDPLEGAGFRLFTDIDCTMEYKLMPVLDEDDNIIAYRPAVGDEAGVEMISAADGKFNIIGLDCGTYYLKETTVPAGYNPCPDVEIVISATHAETNGTPSVTFNAETKNMSNTIVNNAGFELPSTGGIGTTFMYIIGGILVFVAVVFLITKLKMKVN